jgi:hypothetical protein
VVETVAEGLDHPEEEQRGQDDRDADRVGEDRRGQQREDDDARQAGGDDDRAPAGPVGGDPGVQAEQEPGESLEKSGGRYGQRVAGLRGDQKRPGGESDAVAEVGDPGRGQQPAEAAAKTARRDDLGGTAH